jgi:hypothetical protein
MFAIGCNPVLMVGAGTATTSDEPPATDAGSVSRRDAGTSTPFDTGSVAVSGVWIGAIEGGPELPSGSTLVTMVLTAAGDGTVTGTVRFGTLPLLAPPTDPNIGYPPPLDNGGFKFGRVDNLEHFDFTILGGTIRGTSLTFTIDSNEIFSQWCALQTTTYPVYNGGWEDGGLIGYACLPNNGFADDCADDASVFDCCYPPTPGAPPTVVIDCGKLSLCDELFPQTPCSCTASACSVPVPNTGDIAFDLEVTSSGIGGTVAGLSGLMNGNYSQYSLQFTMGD